MIFTTDEKCYIHDVWSKINIDQIGGECLARMLCVYPWMKRYYSTIGDLSSCDAILHNPKVNVLGVEKIKSIEEAVKHLENLDALYVGMGITSPEDPAVAPLYCGIISIVLAMTLGEEYTPLRQAAVEKFLRQCVKAFHSRYF
ncbi:hemoglobin subunit beta-1-like [Lissotriton helveticus]